MLSVIIDEIKLKAGRGEAILSGINFTVQPGSILTIAGKNGSGKSTLLQAIAGLLNERFYSVSGRVLFKGKDILSAAHSELETIRKDKIRYVMQDSANCFNPLKKFKFYFEEILSGKADLKETEDLLEYFKLPGTNKLFSLYPYEVSGGMAQRINFIIALLSKPQILLLDEPTSGIDSPVANLFLLKLKEFATAENHCIIMVTHDLLFAEKISGSIAVLDKGKLSGFHPADEFINIPEYFPGIHG